LLDTGGKHGRGAAPKVLVCLGRLEDEHGDGHGVGQLRPVITNKRGRRCAVCGEFGEQDVRG
jgi:hypothetical protein